MQVPDDLLNRLRKYGQEHVLQNWDRLDVGQRAALVEQLSRIDLEAISKLYASRDKPTAVPGASPRVPSEPWWQRSSMRWPRVPTRPGSAA